MTQVVDNTDMKQPLNHAEHADFEQRVANLRGELAIITTELHLRYPVASKLGRRFVAAAKKLAEAHEELGMQAAADQLHEQAAR